MFITEYQDSSPTLPGSIMRHPKTENLTRFDIPPFRFTPIRISLRPYLPTPSRKTQTCEFPKTLNLPHISCWTPMPNPVRPKSIHKSSQWPMTNARTPLWGQCKMSKIHLAKTPMPWNHKYLCPFPCTTTFIPIISLIKALLEKITPWEHCRHCLV